MGKRCVTNFTASAIASAICLASSGPAAAVEPGIHLGVSWEHLKLPETKYGRTFVLTRAFPRQANGTTENNDGKFDGVRIDLAIGGTSTAFLGGVIAAGVKGFYSWYDKNKETTACQTGSGALGTILCSNDFPLFDPDPNQFNADFFVDELV